MKFRVQVSIGLHNESNYSNIGMFTIDVVILTCCNIQVKAFLALRCTRYERDVHKKFEFTS